MTDIYKTLRCLQQAGSNGVHGFDLNRIIGTTRAAARINDLKKLGYNITSVWENKGNAKGKRYFYHPKEKIAYTLVDNIHNKKVVFGEQLSI